MRASAGIITGRARAAASCLPVALKVRIRQFKFGISPYSTKVVGLDRLKAINRIPFYLAGINANLLVSAICLVVLLFVSNVIIFHILLVNVLLAIVNLFVFPPATDGSKALRALLSSFA